mgnify:CR=1 FL=1
MTRPAITIWRHGQASTPEPLLDIAADGRVTGYTGHVDLGTGLRTAMAQIVAEELDIAPGQVSMVMGDTAEVVAKQRDLYVSSSRRSAAYFYDGNFTAGIAVVGFATVCGDVNRGAAPLFPVGERKGY